MAFKSRIFKNTGNTLPKCRDSQTNALILKDLLYIIIKSCNTWIMLISFEYKNVYWFAIYFALFLFIWLGEKLRNILGRHVWMKKKEYLCYNLSLHYIASKIRDEWFSGKNKFAGSKRVLLWLLNFRFHIILHSLLKYSWKQQILILSTYECCWNENGAQNVIEVNFFGSSKHFRAIKVLEFPQYNRQSSPYSNIIWIHKEKACESE